MKKNHDFNAKILIAKFFITGLVWMVFIRLEKIYRPLMLSSKTQNKLENSQESHIAQQNIEFFWDLIEYVLVFVTLLIFITEIIYLVKLLVNKIKGGHN